MEQKKFQIFVVLINSKLQTSKLGVLIMQVAILLN
jgi:hypothetical protein